MMYGSGQSKSPPAPGPISGAKSTQPLPKLKRRQQLPAYSSAIARARALLLTQSSDSASVGGLPAPLWPGNGTGPNEATPGGTALFFRQLSDRRGGSVRLASNVGSDPGYQGSLVADAWLKPLPSLHAIDFYPIRSFRSCRDRS